MRLTNRDRMEIPLKLWNRNTFFQADHDNQFVMGIYTGFILLLIMINIIMYFAMRDRTFIYHTFFMTAYMVFYMTQFGYTFQYLTPHEFYAVNHHIPLNIALLLVALLLFNAEYLDLKSKSKTEYMASFFLCGVVGTATLIQFFLPYWFAVYTQMVLSVVTIFMVIVMIIRHGPHPHGRGGAALCLQGCGTPAECLCCKLRPAAWFSRSLHAGHSWSRPSDQHNLSGTHGSGTEGAHDTGTVQGPG
ncbi:MAG: 7TM diverse intracellular signaling domain-containing protein, partial [Spirochaetota bacterium]